MSALSSLVAVVVVDDQDNEDDDMEDESDDDEFVLVGNVNGNVAVSAAVAAVVDVTCLPISSVNGDQRLYAEPGANDDEEDDEDLGMSFGRRGIPPPFVEVVAAVLAVADATSFDAVSADDEEDDDDNDNVVEVPRTCFLTPTPLLFGLETRFGGNGSP